MMSIWKFLDCVYFSHMKFRSYVRPGMVTLSWTSMNLVPSPLGGSCGDVEGDDDDLGNGCTCLVSGFLLEVCLGIFGATWTALNSRCIQDVWFARFRWADFGQRFEHWHISPASAFLCWEGLSNKCPLMYQRDPSPGWFAVWTISWRA